MTPKIALFLFLLIAIFNEGSISKPENKPKEISYTQRLLSFL
jgi:hypothetical protein